MTLQQRGALTFVQRLRILLLRLCFATNLTNNSAFANADFHVVDASVVRQWKCVDSFYPVLTRVAKSLGHLRPRKLSGDINAYIRTQWLAGGEIPTIVARCNYQHAAFYLTEFVLQIIAGYRR